MATMMNRGTNSESGQAIVELALTLPLLLLVVLGIFDFGLMFQRFEVVTNAAREGARVAVLPDYTTAQARTHAMNYLNYSGVTGTDAGSSCASTRTVAAGSICISVAASTETVSTSPTITVDSFVVTVQYDHAHVFVGPIVSLFGGSLGTTRLTAVSQMRKE